MFKKTLPCGLMAVFLLCSPVAWAAPCAQKDPAAQLACKMGSSKTQDEANALIPELAKLGAKALPTISKVLKSSKNGKERAAVACTVEVMGATAATVAPELGRVLQDEYVLVRLCALKGLAVVGPWGATAISSIRRSLEGKDLNVQLQALKTIDRLWPVMPVIIPDLVKILDGKRDKRLKYASAQILAKYGALAMGAIPSLRKAMFAPDPKLQGLAVAVVHAMAPASWTESPSLLKLIANPKADAGVRKAAAVAMGKMGKYSKKFKPSLEEAMKIEGAPVPELKAALKAVTGK